MCGYRHAPFLEDLQGNGPCGAKWRGQPTREVSAAPGVLVAVPLGPCREVGVSRAGNREEVSVVAWTGVSVRDLEGERCSAGDPVGVQAREEARLVGLLARRRPVSLSRRAACHEPGERRRIDPEAGGEPFHDAAYGRRVRLAKDRDPERGSERGRHQASFPSTIPPSRRKSSKKAG